MQKPDPVRYRCLSCKETWLQQPRKVLGITGYLIGYTTAASCPNCGHDYVTATD